MFLYGAALFHVVHFVTGSKKREICSVRIISGDEREIVID